MLFFTSMYSWNQRIEKTSIKSTQKYLESHSLGSVNMGKSNLIQQRWLKHIMLSSI